MMLAARRKASSHSFRQHGGQFSSRNWPTKLKTLHLIAAIFDQELKLLVELDTFRNHPQIEFLSYLAACADAMSSQCAALDRAASQTYYSGFCFHLWLDHEGHRHQIADGGTVDWVSKLTSNLKERSFISGCGVEGLKGLGRALNAFERT